MAQSTPLCQSINRDTVARLVHEFYLNVLAEPVLAAYFTHIKDWPQHESHITDFWWGLMGGVVEAPRPHAMEAGHRDLSFGTQELDHWLTLFEQTLRHNLPTDIAEQWGALARRLGEQMTRRGLLSRD